jgi:hypothetical protein
MITSGILIEIIVVMGVRGVCGRADVLQKAFSAHARAVVQVRVDLAHVAEVTMRLVLLEPLLLNAVVDAE